MTQAKLFSLYRELLRASRVASLGTSRGLVRLRARIRMGFDESSKITDVEQQRARFDQGYRTLKFLQMAADPTSTEQKILTTLNIMDHYEFNYTLRPPLYNKRPSPERQKEYEQARFNYAQVLKMLNDTAGLALR